MIISIGWQNADGYSEDQKKTFVDEYAALEFCKRHMDKIIRINGTRFHRDFEDSEDVVIKEISEDDILKAIREKL